MTERVFPVMRPAKGGAQYGRREPKFDDCPRSMPWALVEEHEAQAKANHYQTVARLAERGGLSPIELYAVLTDRGWDVAFAEGPNQEASTRIAIDFLKQKLATS